MIIVCRDGDEWVRWRGTDNVSAAKVSDLLARGVWTEVDLEPYDVAIAVPFVVPPGEIVKPFGAETFEDVDGVPHQVHETMTVPTPNRVSARQFKLQLLSQGLLDDVEGWIEAQGRAVQIAYEASATFVRSDDMMQAGFAALGFTEEQIDQFFAEAAQL